MERHDAANRWGLLVARGAIFIVIGVLLFVFANSFATEAGYLIGGLAIAAGACALIFGFTNQRVEKNNIWFILGGLADAAFGVAIIVFARGLVKEFVDILGFWAIMFAFLQAVQAMYVMFAAKSAGGMSYPGKVVHFLLVAAAGGMAFTLLLRPQGFYDSLGLIGFFPMIMGALLIFLARQLKAQSVLNSNVR